MVLPIGGADMPVVISLLNAFTGTAVAMAGFVLENTMLIIAGALVGASGSILTKLMADAMNRSIGNIVAGGFGTGDSAAPVTAGMASVREVSVDDVAIQLAYASKVIFVPGYGLAAAQAQHEAAELGELLERHGVEVDYAIHPVAGRMPGHMNVLLAEANVPYPQLKEMEQANTEFARADVALVVGANDVTNPAAPATPCPACRSSTSTRPRASSSSSGRWATATRESTTSSKPTPRPACCSATRSGPSPRSPPRSRRSSGPDQHDGDGDVPPGGGDRSESVAALAIPLPWMIAQGYRFDFPA
jgi:hypothetical protein